MHELSFAALSWREAPMPCAAALEMALLPRLADGGFRAFIRFPAGWWRPQVGHYAVPEEFLVLEGELELSGDTWKRGELAWIPAWQRRHDLGSRAGCLVFAWFGGTPRWISGEPAQAAAGPRNHTYIQGRELVRLLPETARETLDLDDYTWRVVRA